MVRELCKGIAIVGCLLTAQQTYAIPMRFDVTSTADTVAVGAWTLSGPTADEGVWAVGPAGFFSDGTEIGPGEYTWSIFGLGGAWGYGEVSWSLFLNGALLDSGSDAGAWVIKVFDTTNFEVGRPVPVPEPGALSLLGLGMVALGYSVRRRRSRT